MCFKQQNRIMKNISLALNVVLLIAVAVLYYFQFSSQKTAHPEITETTEKEIVEVDNEASIRDTNYISKIGYINVDSLQLKYDLYEELKTKLEKKEKSYDSELKAKSAEFQRKIEDFRKKAPSMTQFEGELKQKELADEEEKLYKMRDQYAQNYEQEMLKLNNQLYKAIKDYIITHNKNTHYDIIIGESQTRNFVLDFNKNIDITLEVVEGLNKKYQEDNAPKPTKP